jgi:hypothetical protein
MPEKGLVFPVARHEQVIDMLAQGVLRGRWGALEVRVVCVRPFRRSAGLCRPIYGVRGLALGGR